MPYIVIDRDPMVTTCETMLLVLQLCGVAIVRGQYADVPWNSACAHMFGFFLASMFKSESGFQG